MTRQAAIVALVLLGGCSSAERAAPVADEGVAWRYSRDTQGNAYLDYGLPGAEEVPVLLSCPPGSRAAQIVTTTPSPDGDLHGTIHTVQALPLTAPALVGLRTTGRLPDPTGGTADYSARTAAEREAIEGFFQTCEAAG